MPHLMFKRMNMDIMSFPPQPDLQSIAKATGFSPSAVSKALNPDTAKRGRLSAKTCDLIIRAAAKQGYIRNRAAEFMKRGKEPLIGVFLPWTRASFVLDFLIGVSDQAREENFPLRFYFGRTIGNYIRFMEQARQRRHCGMITFSVQGLHGRRAIESKVRSFAAQGNPMVVINPDVVEKEVLSVRVDNRMSGVLAAQRLLADGCSSFLVCGEFGDRHTGFIEYMRRNGRDAKTIKCSVIRGLIKIAEEQLVMVFRKMPCFPVGIFAMNDEIALLAIRILEGAGWKCGRDFFVVGHDDHDLGRYSIPTLTTIHQPFQEAGKIAVNLLIQRIYGRKANAVTLQPLLIPRESG